MNKTIMYIFSIFFLGMLVLTGCTKSDVNNPQNDSTVSDSRQYISTNPTQCAATDWICENGMQQFYDSTGCGCEPTMSTCGNGVCESGEADQCPACYDSIPPCLAPCTKGTCTQDCVSGKLKATDCTDPRPEACTLEYAPVCGWFDSAKIQCIKYPCAQTFGNKCGACADPGVISWTEGECPK